jgi:hypothetical protein
MRRFTIALCVAVGLSALVVGSGSIASASPAKSGASGGSPHGGVLVRTNAHAALPRSGGTVSSLNWSGYAVTPTAPAVTQVTSTFIVPTAGLFPVGFAATWTGIGGFASSDLIQAGVAEQSLPSLPLIGAQYFPWYELLPGAEVQLTGCAGDSNCTVAPGDSMAIIITQVATNTWAIAFANSTRHWTWTQAFPYKSSKSSAEWIVEAPSVESLQTIVAPLSTVNMGPVNTFREGGSTFTIAQGNPTRIILTSGIFSEATPSTLAANGQSFRVCTYANTCAAP